MMRVVCGFFLTTVCDGEGVGVLLMIVCVMMMRVWILDILCVRARKVVDF